MKHQSITSLPASPDADRHSRMLKYTLAMSIRMLCIISLLFVRDWWLIIPALGAVFLPYVAVVIANATSSGRATTVLRPGGVVPFRGDNAGHSDAREPSEPTDPGGVSDSGDSSAHPDETGHRAGGDAAGGDVTGGGLMGIGGGPDRFACSRAECTRTAQWRIEWRNPRIHSPERTKTWLACADHRDFLREYLANRDFPVSVVPLQPESEPEGKQ